MELGWLKTELVDWHELKAFQGNLKDLSKTNYERLKKTILKNRFSEPFSIWEDEKGVKHLLNGHQRLRCLFMMEQDGYEIPTQLPVNFIKADNKKQAKALVLSLASQYGEVTEDGLYEFASEAEISFDEMKDTFHFPEIDFDKYEADYGEEQIGGDEKGNMAEKFGAAPFSVLNAREGWWQDRKRAWLSIGIKSELGRGGGRSDSELQEPGKTLGATPPNQKDLYKRMRK